jgi:ribosomal protein S14
MLALKIKDLKNRKLYLKTEKKIIIARFLFIHYLNKPTLEKNKLLFLYFLIKYQLKYNFRYKMKTKLVRRCIVSNRGRSTFRPYGVSRFILRNFMQFGVLPGFKKAVW